MSKKTDFFGFSQLKNLKVLCCLAIFVAISIVMGKFLAISIGDALRLSFENLTIILSGMMFGPIAGAFAGICADLIGCILRGYNIIPILTVGAALIGFISGVLFSVLKNSKTIIRVSVSCFLAHLLGSVFVKTCGLTMYYSMPFYETLALRCLNYLIVFAAETFVLYFIVKNKGFITQIKRLKG